MIKAEQEIYQTFQINSRKQLENLTPDKVHLFNHELVPENYTVILRYPQPVLNLISEIIDQAKQIDSNHYYYPIKRLHSTVLGLIDIETNQDLLINLAEDLIDQFSFKFHLWGINSNHKSASIKAYPEEFSMFQVRNFLREKVGDENDDYSVHLSEYEYLSWINFMRYQSQPKEELLDYFKTLIEKDFGYFAPGKIQIFKNKSYVLELGECELVYDKDI